MLLFISAISLCMGQDPFGIPKMASWTHDSQSCTNLIQFRWIEMFLTNIILLDHLKIIFVSSFSPSGPHPMDVSDPKERGGPPNPWSYICIFWTLTKAVWPFKEHLIRAKKSLFLLEAEIDLLLQQANVGTYQWAAFVVWLDVYFLFLFSICCLGLVPWCSCLLAYRHYPQNVVLLVQGCGLQFSFSWVHSTCGLDLSFLWVCFIGMQASPLCVYNIIFAYLKK